VTTTWQTHSLEEIAYIQGGGTPSRKVAEYFGGDIPWVTPTDLPPIGIVGTLRGTKECISRSGLTNSSAKLIDAGSVLFSSRASIGKIVVTECPCTTNQGFANFTPRKEMVDPWFLAYLLRRYTPEITSLAGKTTFLEVPRGRLKLFKARFPDLAEQRRIVARIKECMERVDEIEELRAHARLEIDAMVTSLIFEMWHSDGLRECPRHSLSRVATITTGNTPSRKRPEFFGGEQPWVTPGDIDGRLISTGREFLSRRGISEGNARIASKGSVLVVCIGATIGKMALAARDLGINQQINAVMFDNTQVIPEFGYWACRGLAPSIRANASKNTLPILNKSRFSTLEIPIPPLNRQRKVAEQLDAAEAAVAEMASYSGQAMKMIASLRESILRKAFAGEL